MKQETRVNGRIHILSGFLLCVIGVHKETCSKVRVFPVWARCWALPAAPWVLEMQEAAGVSRKWVQPRYDLEPLGFGSVSKKCKSLDLFCLLDLGACTAIGRFPTRQRWFYFMAPPDSLYYYTSDLPTDDCIKQRPVPQNQKKNPRAAPHFKNNSGKTCACFSYRPVWSILLQVKSVISERNMLNSEHVTNSAYFEFSRIMTGIIQSHWQSVITGFWCYYL